MNNVSIIGRLVYEPELKTTQSGTGYLPLRIAVDRHDKNKSTDFFSAKAWNKTAEFISKYFHKGDPIEITGKLQTDSYEKQDGTKVTEVFIYVSEVGFTMTKKEGKTEELIKADPPKDLPFEI